tara:strand:+ start:116 stop:235 length:120 start_codon:yes stop_codon:yes gene_type:complete
MGLNTKVIYVGYRNLLWDFYTKTEEKKYENKVTITGAEK